MALVVESLAVVSLGFFPDGGMFSFGRWNFPLCMGHACSCPTISFVDSDCMFVGTVFNLHALAMQFLCNHQISKSVTCFADCRG